MDTLDRAEAFLLLNGRLLDRLRFDHLFRDGDPARVVDALRPYRNPDGGFGHALEPDLRGPESQPVPVELALFIMDEAGVLDGDLLDGLLRYLTSITRPDGGVPWLLPTTSPRGPWWQAVDGLPGSLNPTASIAALLLKLGVTHAWLDPAVDFCWAALDNLTEVGPYDVRTILPFLEQAPDQARAEAAWASFGRQVHDMTELDPAVEGDVFGPLAFAPRPDSLARSVFPAAVVDQHLDKLAAAQRDDGGWDFAFESWTPITRPEWRGWVTVESLTTLRDNGRL